MKNVGKWQRAPFVIFPFVVGLNFVLLALFLTSAYQGRMDFHGLGDFLFGSRRVLGWRPDMVWLIFSTLYVLAMGMIALRRWDLERTSKRTLVLCICWLAAVGACMWHLLNAGLLYKG